MNRHPHTLVAVHIPKTAGISFRAAMQTAYGDGLRLDYGDRPLAHSRSERRRAALGAALRQAGRSLPVTAVSGHFMPLKYALARRTRFAVWLRDPVQRVLSRYHHYLRDCIAGETLHARWGLVPGLSLEQFARIPQYQNSYREYFWLFPLRRFEFIGFVEQYDVDLRRFAERFGIDAPLPSVQANVHADHDAPRYSLKPGDERLIRGLNSADIAIYEQARSLPASGR
jgi:hypothetical protein